MDVEWVAIALGDVTWITLAFVLGYAARLVTLPPLVGFLVTGFVLNYFGMASGETLQKLADLGITLLLFTVGLKLNLKVLVKPQVWSVTLLHTSIVIAVFGAAILALSFWGISIFAQLDAKLSLMIAFSLSFSSTVFVVKSLEEKGEMNSLHGRVAIGILVMQDILAVIFLAVSSGKVPSYWALLLLLLIPLRPLFHYVLKKIGHGELLILYGLVLALGGAEIFEISGIKDDLGALFMGLLISTNPKAKEMAKSMLGFKDLFLVGFFLSIGLSGVLSLEALIIGLLLVPFILIKSSLFFVLMTRFKLRSRTALLASLSLINYSEFGLIVAAIGVKNGWIDSVWLTIIAIALSVSFVVAAAINNIDNSIYSGARDFWLKFQSSKRLNYDQLYKTLGATIAIFGMGRVGSAAYDKMREKFGDTVVGVDFDVDLVKTHQKLGRKVLHGDPSDADFWEQLEKNHTIQLVMLSLPKLTSNLDALKQLKNTSFTGQIAATARYPDEVEKLKLAGATVVFDMYTDAGIGFANHVVAYENMG
jgi:predicted Kef-type K+ transport protein